MSQYSQRSMLPVFALGGIVSGYASVDSTGSAEGTDDKMINAKPDVVMEAVEKVRRHGQEVVGLVRRHGQENFKSEFAKELNEKHFPVDNIRNEPGTKEKRDSLIKAGCGWIDLNRLKLENEVLKLNIENCLIEEKRYEHIQYELSQLRQKITKVIEWHQLTKINAYTQILN